MAAAERSGQARRGRGRRISAPLLVFGLILAGFWAAALVVLGVDAPDVYPWGVRARLPDRMGPNDGIYLVSRIARDPQVRTVLVGDSTTAIITAEDIGRWMPASGRAANISYSGARPGDWSIVLDRLARDSRADHVVLLASWFLTLPSGEMRADFPAYLYDANRTNDLRAVSPRLAPLALRALAGKPVIDGPAAYRAFERDNVGQHQTFQTARRMKRLAKTIAAAGPDIARPTALGCDDLTALSHDLAPFIKAMTARGARVDIVMPTYSWAFYGERAGSVLAKSRYGDTFLADQIMLRRCLVERFADIPNVRLFAFDTDPAMGDMANYRDTSHLMRKDFSAGVLRSVAADRGRLRRDNIDVYLADLQARAAGYRVYNSSIKGFDRAHP